MAKIDMGKIMRDLERELKPMLLEFLGDVAPEVKGDKDKLFKAFKEQVDRHFRRPQDVPDDLVHVESKT